MMSEEIKPCPFCGGTDIRFTNHGRISTNPLHRYDDVWSMACYDCEATFPNRYLKELLITCWNRRDDTELKKLKDANAGLVAACDSLQPRTRIPARFDFRTPPILMNRKGQIGTALQTHSFHKDRKEQAAFDRETRELTRRFKPKDQPKLRDRSKGYQQNLAILRQKLRNRSIPPEDYINLDLGDLMRLWKQVKDNTRQKLPT